MMIELLIPVWALGTGIVLGTFFFGGLWWTVHKGTACRRPGLLFLGSFLLRTGIALAGLYFVADGHWVRLAACLLGFVLARSIVTKLVGPPDVPCAGSAKETGHAPQSR